MFWLLEKILKAVNFKLTCSSFFNQIMENWFVIATFKFVHRFLWCYHSNETFLVERFSLYSIFLGILWREFDCFYEVFFVHWITRVQPHLQQQNTHLLYYNTIILTGSCSSNLGGGCFKPDNIFKTISGPSSSWNCVGLDC